MAPFRNTCTDAASLSPINLARSCRRPARRNFPGTSGARMGEDRAGQGRGPHPPHGLSRNQNCSHRIRAQCLVYTGSFFFFLLVYLSRVITAHHAEQDRQLPTADALRGSVIGIAPCHHYYPPILPPAPKKKKKIKNRPKQPPEQQTYQVYTVRSSETRPSESVPALPPWRTTRIDGMALDWQQRFFALDSTRLFSHALVPLQLYTTPACAPPPLAPHPHRQTTPPFRRPC